MELKIVWVSVWVYDTLTEWMIYVVWVVTKGKYIKVNKEKEYLDQGFDKL